MTTPGPRSDRWRVRRSAGRHPTLDLNIPPYPIRPCTPTRWQAETYKSPDDRAKFRIVVTEHNGYHVGAAPECRPWNRETEVEMADLTCPIAPQPSPIVTEEVVSSEMASSPIPAPVTDTDSEQGSEDGAEAQEESSEITPEESNAPEDDRSKLAFAAFLQIAFCAPVIYQLFKLLPVKALLFADRALSVLVMGGGLRLAGLGLENVKDIDTATITNYLALLGLTGICKTQTHPLLYPAAYGG